MESIYSFVGSYGWTIIIVTVLMRLAVLPLDIKQRRGMRIQQRLQPQIQAIQKKYANDQATQQKKTQELYKEAGYSPFAGCLPMLVQMIVFFAFFGAQRAIAYEQIEGMFHTAQALLPETLVDNYQFEGFLWIQNLWQADTFDIGISQINSGLIPTWKQLAAYESMVDNFNLVEATYTEVMAPSVDAFKGTYNGLFILPVLATAASFLQSKLTMANQPTQQPAPQKDGAPAQPNMKIFQYMMPVMSLIICTTTSAAYALYWTTTSLIAVISYIIINKVLNKEDEAKAELEEVTPSRKMKERKLPKI